jgi:hypothetical protein
MAESSTAVATALALPDGPLARHADAVFAATSPYPGHGLRNHCHRLWHFTQMLMRREGLAMDPEVSYAVAMWHDLGLVSEKDEGHAYPVRSRALFEREAAGFDLRGEPADAVAQALLYNHRMFPVPNLSPVAECFRKAVWLEHSRGLLRFGLPRVEVNQVFSAYARDDFDRVLVDFTWRVVRREPLTLVSGIFFGPTPKVAA